MDSYGIWAALPPLVAIVLCFKTKMVLPSLFAGLLTGAMVISGGNVLSGVGYALEKIVENVVDPWNARLLLFTMFMGVGISFI
ncbi:MAG: Na+/H+ antiporter NhaC family protein, partial [Dethiosulfovibrio sp.]|nr:Na+/H+ antiporter NhaC family protein [Dethiosulfovibrio sp.]